MDDFMNKSEAMSRAEFETWRKGFTDTKNKQFRCLANRAIVQDERISLCVRLSIGAFVMGVIAIVLVALF